MSAASASQPVDPDADDTRGRLLRAALPAFNAGGVAAASIHDICAAASVSIGSAYHHFGNKQGLAAALLAAGLHAHLRQLEPRLSASATPKQAVKAVVGALLEWVTANPEWARFIYSADAALLQTAPVLAVNAEYDALIGARIQPWLEQGALRRLPADSYAPLILGPAHDYARRWLDGRAQTPPDELAATFQSAAWRVVKPKS